MESNITKENYEYFSKLLIIPLLSFDEVLTRKVDEVLELYFSGSIISIVVFDENIINFIVNKLNERMSSENVYYKNGEIYIDLFNSNNSLNYNGKGYFSIFNFSIYLVKDLVAPSRFIEINNGELLGENILSCNKLFKYLEEIEANSNFNLASYCIQHNVIDEDILISASAGTGKTFSIVSRIMYLLYKSNYDKYFLKDEILLITFTNEATNEMKSRLIKCLENYYKLTKDKKYLECANEVVNSKIATIHSFSIDLIRSNSEVLDLANNFEMVSGIYDIRNIIYIQLEKKIGDYEKYLQKHKIKMKTLKDEILKFYKAILAKNIDLLDLDNNWGIVEEEHIDFSNMLINVLKESYQIYSDKNKVENRFSLGEVNINLKRLLNRNNLKMDNKYKYIFIDEFQDTDDIQIKVINKLKKDNNIKLFVVGDIKQAIYRFRGSDITAFNKISESISFKKYSLTKNYRTTKSLYQSLNCVFENMNKFKLISYERVGELTKIDNKVYCKNIPKSTYKEDIINKVVEIVKEIMEACNKENIYNIKGIDGGDLYNNIEAIELLKLLNALIFYDNIEY
ncbi:UvrD-helicase domain-containing protein, partial [Clostridium sp.]|uniref:UvrD-helicase domain-containing protein n=1 Tax=Clostridium sp. TaxID=1506 RepID=UPI003F3E3CBF